MTCGKCRVVVSNIPETFCLLILPLGGCEDNDNDGDDDDNNDIDDDDDDDA